MLPPHSRSPLAGESGKTIGGITVEARCILSQYPEHRDIRRPSSTKLSKAFPTHVPGFEKSWHLLSVSPPGNGWPSKATTEKCALFTVQEQLFLGMAICIGRMEKACWSSVVRLAWRWLAQPRRDLRAIISRQSLYDPALLATALLPDWELISKHGTAIVMGGRGGYECFGP